MDKQLKNLLKKHGLTELFEEGGIERAKEKIRKQTQEQINIINNIGKDTERSLKPINSGISGRKIIAASLIPVGAGVVGVGAGIAHNKKRFKKKKFKSHNNKK